MRKLKKHIPDPIPCDLLIDIFSRVPAKSIARFRCVSKLWASILGDPYFTKLFLTRSSTCPRLFFTIEANGKLFSYSSPQPQNLDDDDNLTSLVATKYHTFSPKYLPCRVCTPLHGLVCIVDWAREDTMRVIFNPITGESILLPKVEAKNSRSYFGYDPIEKQFKVLCMTLDGYKTFSEHRILTLETGKEMVWRPIKCKPHFPNAGRICINGVLYYRAGSDASMMVCFDVRSEKFSFISKGPDGTLINYKGKLGVIHFMLNMLQLVVLEDAAGKHEWTTKHTRIMWNALEFVGMIGTGEILVSPYCLSDPFYIFYYNLEKNTFRRINIQGFDEYLTNRRIHTFLDYIEDVTLMQSTCLELHSV